ncbi:hypothetical protein [Chelatococcus asaccharovorans]|uniref:Uncharacterized protein n=1 Tax=Chelatococcus asaccharovorans TaxID=28210 RepID=A0A2V3UDM8_9HYPH|nr:hypothetical protein [Chelatococcus asaccharovorans]MBS7703275.1 hypothetical protein [Chelatococcus asaccharovorans]PXW61606.1 hypothetical protein C7450_103123 [Chelatococcus asaccharovorans]
MRTFAAQVAARVPEAVVVEQILKSTGMRVPAHRQQPSRWRGRDFYPLGTAMRLVESHGEIVVSTTLRLLCEVGFSDGPRADLVRSLAEIVRMNPLWVKDWRGLVTALRGLRIDRLRAEARKLGTPGALTRLLVQDLTVVLGSGR